MRSFLARHWFLLALAVGVPVACARSEWVRPWTDRLSPQVVVAAALFLVAWSLEGRSLYQAAIRPGPALWGLAVSYGALPLMAWGAGPLLPREDLRIGLLIAASVPCTLASAVLWTRLAGGNDAVALLAIVLSTGLGWLFTPLWLTLATGAHTALDPGRLMRDLVLVLVVPVALGQLSRTVPVVARVVTRHRVLNGAVSRLLVFSIILKAAASLGDRVVSLEPGVLLLAGAVCLGTHLAALLLGLGGARALGFTRADAIAVAFSGSQKTLPVSLFLFEVYFQAAYPLAVVALVFYHVGQLVVDTFIAEGLARRAGVAG